MSGIDAADVRKLVIACDAGMGSSVMLASQLKRELRKVPVTVEHHPIGAIPADTDLVLCHAGLAERARHSAPGAIVVGFRVFLGDPAVARVVAALRQGGRVDGTVGG